MRDFIHIKEVIKNMADSVLVVIEGTLSEVVNQKKFVDATGKEVTFSKIFVSQPTGKVGISCTSDQAEAAEPLMGKSVAAEAEARIYKPVGAPQQVRFNLTSLAK